ncbi:MAG: ABC transporter permease subunit [Candidatus Hydrogenedentota bacterium]
MGNSWVVCKREFKSYFSTPVGYVVLGTYAMISGLGFSFSFILYSFWTEAPGQYKLPAVPDFEEAFLSEYLVYCGLIMMFIGPLITMRLLAEERYQGTIELLLTHPLRDRDIVFGKYLASLSILGLMFVVTSVNMGIAYYFVDVEIEVLLFGLLAFFLMGATFLSMGLFVSSICRTQITAATLTFAAYFVFFMMGYMAEDMPEDLPVPPDWSERSRDYANTGYEGLRTIVKELPIDAHARQMAQGIFQPVDVAYYVLFILFFLFLTFRSLEMRKWRG